MDKLLIPSDFSEICFKELWYNRELKYLERSSEKQATGLKHLHCMGGEQCIINISPGIRYEHSGAMQAAFRDS